MKQIYNMKKLMLTAAALAAGIAAGAQDWTDALRYSENEYEGTARTMAMGNAFTALGGDMGSLGINPAGSAVARKSQFTFSAGPNITIGTARGNRTPDGEIAFGKNIRQTDAKFNIPNLGGMVNFNTGRSRGLKNWSMGFVVNNTRTYDDNLTAKGINYKTSAFGQLAAHATDLAQEGAFAAGDLDKDEIFDRLSPVDWNIANAYRAGSIWALSDKEFAGISEYENGGKIVLGKSGLNQLYGRTRTGRKSDFVYNLAFNISDIFFFGANVGVTHARYTSTDFMREDAVSPDDFDIIFNNSDGSTTTTHFVSAKNTYSYQADATGVYGKFGIILTPWRGLRIGAAIQTPTQFSVKEEITYGSSSTYDVSKFSGDAQSSGKFEYILRSPMRSNFGLAYTFGKYGLISADYEVTNYRSMRFRVPNTSDNSDYDSANAGIYDLCGVQHYFRAGAEVNVAFLSIRAGYSLKTAGQTYEYDGSSLVKAPKTLVQTVSGGLGFSFGGFFADLAAVGYFYPTEYIRPYPDYIFGDNDIPDPYSPEIRYKRNLVKLVATIGVRF